MLLVQVRVGQSLIHGLGIFAVEPIAKGRPVWRFTPGFDLDLDPSLLDEQPSHFRQTMLHYGYIDIRLNRFILCCDDYRFVNHSDTPNIYVDVGADRYGIDVAARDIEAGEELTVDYAYVEGIRPEGM
ncbi:MAG TPA: SET domain-containing protein [Candidatus Limnocylindria bacterium]|nr:SET domain-containing protein [Candidatus Limnocylindria bacterium]